MDDLCTPHKLPIVSSLGCAEATKVLSKYLKKEGDTSCTCEVGTYCPHDPTLATPFSKRRL